MTDFCEIQWLNKTFVYATEITHLYCVSQTKTHQHFMVCLVRLVKNRNNYCYNLITR